MQKIFALLALLLTALITINVQAKAPYEVGVKAGDWIEYKVDADGDLPLGFNLTWARMDFLEINGSRIKTNLSVQASDGNYSRAITIFDLEAGKIGAWFIIPSNLDAGDVFYDALLGRDVTIEAEEEFDVAGERRTVVSASTVERLKHWDKSTGVFIECIDVLEHFSVNATVIRTNMWGNQGSSALVHLLFGVCLSSIFIFAAIVVARIRINKKRNQGIMILRHA